MLKTERAALAIQRRVRGRLSRKSKVDVRALKKAFEEAPDAEGALRGFPLQARTFMRGACNLLLFRQLLSKHKLHFFKKKQRKDALQGNARAQALRCLEPLCGKPPTARKLSEVVKEMRLER